MSRKPRIDERTSLEDLAALVCSTLEAHDISVVLSGGAVVSIYSDAEYVSYDLDFIPIGLARKVDAAMQSLGFEKTQRHWTHPKSRYWVEFSAGSRRDRRGDDPRLRGARDAAGDAATPGPHRVRHGPARLVLP